MRTTVQALLAGTSGMLIAISVASAAAGITPIRSILVVEDGRPIGSLRNPSAGSELIVPTQEGEHNLQAILQIHAIPDIRTLALTQMEDAVITALSKEGTVGDAVEGGWEFQAKDEQDVMLILTGRAPPQAKAFDLVQVVAATGKEVRTEARVRGIVTSRRHLPLAWLLVGMSILALAVAVGLGVWRRQRIAAARGRP